jgi:Ulp1 protease family, C-terminal catalytic domain
MNIKKYPYALPGPMQCHPAIGAVRPEEGCLPMSTLQQAAGKLGLATGSSGVELRKSIEKSLNLKPNQEATFLRALPLSQEEKKDLENKYLRPPAPTGWIKDPDMWLDSTNITNVMKQYEVSNRNFKFMGPFPIDFSAPDPYDRKDSKKCLMNEMCELNVKNAKENGTDMIGIVYNLDPHFKNGSHWVASFLDIKNSRCLYFDSYGYEPPKQIGRFMKWLTTQDPAMELSYSSRKLQSSNTECGMFCMYFLIRMISGDKFVEFSRKKPTDQFMLYLRKHLFSV